MTTHLQVYGGGHNPRNPFDSPCPSHSTASINGTDDGSTSGQDEFHLERYSSNAKYQHLRQISRSSNGEAKDKKPDLAIITDFAGPKMPMKSAAVIVNEVPARQTQADRRKKAFSIVSHKAVQSATSPSPSQKFSPRLAVSASKRSRVGFRRLKESRDTRQKDEAMAFRKARATEKIPIGISIPGPEAAVLEHNILDSALTIMTPETPAIVITAAGNPAALDLDNIGSRVSAGRPQKPRLIAISGKNRMVSPSSIRQPVAHVHTAPEQYPTFPDSADSARPKSQGWWNLMLSPLLRAGSLASRKNFQASDTPPVPPVPFAATRTGSPPLSSKSTGTSFLGSNQTSPDTPRRQGLATTPASTWSRWTEWEKEREAQAKSAELNDTHENMLEKCLVPQDSEPKLSQAAKAIGLAAEYFHACAVEQLTGQPYFECINHSCAQQLPKLRSVYDTASRGQLASPFQTPLLQYNNNHNNSTEMKKSNWELAVAEPTIVTEAVDRDIDNEKTVDDKVKEGSEGDCRIPVSKDATDKAETNSPIDTKPMTLRQPFSPISNKSTEAPIPQVVDVKVRHEFVNNSSSTSGPPQNISTEPVQSPGTISPAAQKTMAPQEGVAMINLTHGGDRSFTDKQESPAHRLPERPAFITAETEYPALPQRVHVAPITSEDLENKNRRLESERRRQRHEKEDNAAKKIGSLWRGRGCFPASGCMGRGGPEKRARRRWIICLVMLILAIVIISIVLAVTLTRRGDATPVESQWLNLTGYPAMPVGILTIAAPNLVAKENQCTVPTTMWSCSVPKDQQTEIGPNAPDQPNFRFEIRFRNGTVPANLTIPLPGTKPRPTSTSSDPFTNDLFVANPPTPNQPDQLFLGQTTDNITVPFNGEETPFYISFMSAFPQIPDAFQDNTTKSVTRRSTNGSLNGIPAPAINSDGTPVPAALVPINPFPLAQPVRLYNRGLQDEHYGFYTYYDKSIYLSGVSIDNGAPSAGSNIAVDADQDGGSLKSQARTVCTWSQTRFLVKIFTNPSFGASLLPSTINANLTDPEDNKSKNKTSSATNFDRPGSFPYPTTIIVDRHGGDIDSKAIYCYGIDNGQVLTNSRMLNGEVRGFNGQLINAVPSIDGDNSSFNRTAGGIDGGTGGCFCNWQNWQ